MQKRHFRTTLWTRASHYEILNLPPTATAAEIRSQFLTLSLETHPDRIPSTATAEEKKLYMRQFLRTKTAYEILRDPTKRMEYDLQIGAVGLKRGPSAGGADSVVKASSDFSAWSTASGVPPDWLRYTEEEKSKGWKRWAGRVERVHDEDENDEEDEELLEWSRKKGSGPVTFKDRMRMSVGRTWRRWKRKMGNTNQTSPYAAAAGVRELNYEDMPITKDTLVITGGVWAVVLGLSGLAWFYFIQKLDANPEELAKRNAAAKAAAAMWDTPHHSLEGFAKNVEGYKMRREFMSKQADGQHPQRHYQNSGGSFVTPTGVWPTAVPVAPSKGAGQKIPANNALPNPASGPSSTSASPTGKGVPLASDSFDQKDVKVAKELSTAAAPEEQATDSAADERMQGMKSRLVIDANIVQYVNMAAERNRRMEQAAVAMNQQKGQTNKTEL
ncbi:hypothetical protein HDU97_006269 [Phlyctochytrium planicorne]|nr:hypothetical protein HDU97_006269 [Phlyctochytrium planicorne]